MRAAKRITSKLVAFAAVLFELDGGALGTMLVSQMAPGRKNALVLEVHGQSESLRFAQERPEELWVGRRSGSSVLLRDPETAAPDAALCCWRRSRAMLLPWNCTTLSLPSTRLARLLLKDRPPAHGAWPPAALCAAGLPALRR